MLFILAEFNIGVSPKCYNEEGVIPIVETVKAAGYNISRGGIGCGEEFLEVMRILLTKHIRSVKQLESLIGSILQAHVAFRFTTEQISVFGELMAQLQAVLKAAKAGEGIN